MGNHGSTHDAQPQSTRFASCLVDAAFRTNSSAKPGMSLRSRSQPATVTEKSSSTIRSISPELFVPAEQSSAPALPAASSAREARTQALVTLSPPNGSIRTTSLDPRLDQSSRISTVSTGAVAAQLRALRVKTVTPDDRPSALEAVLAALVANSSSAAIAKVRSLLSRLDITTAEHIMQLRLLSPQIRDAMLGAEEREILAPFFAR